jgi:hypothetical protein
MCYEKLLPRQPSEGALEWYIREKFKEEYAIYRDAWWRDPLTGIKENGVSVTCSACGGRWFAKKGRGADCGKGWAPFGFVEGVMQIGPEDRFRCPKCGAELRAKHIGQLSRAGIDDNVYFCEPWQLGEKFVLLGWRAERNTGKDAQKVYRMWPYEAYVFEKRKAVRLTGYQKYMSTISFFNRWRQVKRCDDRWGKKGRKDWFRWPEKLDGTTIEHSGLDLYLKAAGDDGRPVAYLRLWQKHRNLENLIVQGCGKMIAEAICRECNRYGSNGSARLEWIDWKQKRPAKMLGLNKQEFSVCVQEQWTQDDLARYKMVRAYEPVRSPEDWRLIKKQTIYSLEKLCRETWLSPSAVGGCIEKAWRGNLSIMRCLRYLERQKSDVVTMLDYWRMANRAGLDIWDEHVKLPKNLNHEHDRLMEAERIEKNEEEKRKKLAEIEKRRPAFEKVVAPLEAWAWEDGGICIRPVHTEQELMDEGATLNHCVGGYGQTVAKGESCIFFIRRADAPEKPWYTLQVELKTLKEIQNHGLRNRGATKEVQEFVNRWLAHVRALKTASKKRKETAA